MAVTPRDLPGDFLRFPYRHGGTPSPMVFVNGTIPIRHSWMIILGVSLAMTKKGNHNLHHQAKSTKCALQQCGNWILFSHGDPISLRQHTHTHFVPKQSFFAWISWWWCNVNRELINPCRLFRWGWYYASSNLSLLGENTPSHQPGFSLGLTSPSLVSWSNPATAWMVETL